MRIVIIGEDQRIREELSKKIKNISKKHSVVAVAKGAQGGYWIITQSKPDLAIIDTKLADGSVLELMQWLKKEKNQTQIAVLAEQDQVVLLQKAVSLGIVGFLMKPTMDGEMLRQMLDSVSKLSRNKGLMSTENILKACVLGELKESPETEQEIAEKYGISLSGPGTMICLWGGDEYQERKGQFRTMLATIMVRYKDMPHVMLNVDNEKYVALFLLHNHQHNPIEEIRKDFLLTYKRKLGSNAVFFESYIKNFYDVPVLLTGVPEQFQWALLFPYAVSFNWLEATKMKAACKEFIYPVDIEEKVIQGLIEKDSDKITNGYQELYQYLKVTGPYHPKEIRQAFIRMTWNLMSAAKGLTSDQAVLIEGNLFQIAIAVNWHQIQKHMLVILREINFFMGAPDIEKSESEMIGKVNAIIESEYMNTLNLTNVAKRLYVSPEYLSTQYKKAMGFGFNQALRERRLESVKMMLLGTTMSIKEIAHTAGFADEKYMSRVFRKQEGKTPKEYRKAN